MISSRTAALLIALAQITSAGAFGVSPAFTSHASSETFLQMTKNEDTTNGRRNFLTNGGVTATTALLISGGILGGNVNAANAEAIKTLDFSLPGYDSISSPKSAADDVPMGELKKTQGKSSSSSSSSSSPSSKKKAEKKSSAKSFSMSNVFGDDSGDGSPKPVKEKPEPKKAPVVETVDMNMPSYGGASVSGKKSPFAL